MLDGSNRLTRGKDSSYETKNAFQYLKYGEVMDIDDPLGLNRIKVYIKGSVANGGDDELIGGEIGYSKLPWCLPLMPKHISIKPKVGEGVLIFLFSRQKENIDRLYIGPIISQSNKLDFDSARTTALGGFSFGPVLPNVTPNNVPSLKGVFPDPNDVSIQGRYNTDITQKDNEIVIRAGKFTKNNIPQVFDDNPYPIKFNSQTQAFIQIKNEIKLPKLSETEISDRFGTVTNIVSNKINLITHGGSPSFNTTNQIDLISSQEMEKILSTAHQLPYGDVLIEYLRLLKNALLSHVHNGNGKTATDLVAGGDRQDVAEFLKKSADLEKNMLSQNVRIN
jgi:hypothetical protein